MARRRGRFVSLAIGLLLVGLAGAAPAPLSPEETLQHYLQAVKDGKFDDAYDLVSKDMRRGRDKEVWVKEQKAGMSFAEVKIFEFRVQPAKVDGDTAMVPNILDSQDRFVNQLGLTEYELYTLVKEDGRWKVDQQTIVEPPDVPKWFPDSAPK